MSGMEEKAFDNFFSHVPNESSFQSLIYVEQDERRWTVRLFYVRPTNSKEKR